MDAAKRRYSTCSSSGSSRSLTSSHYLDEHTDSKSNVQKPPPLHIETVQENSSLKQEESLSTSNTSMESRNDKEDTSSFTTSKSTCKSTRADDMERDAASKSDASSSSTKIRYQHECRQDEKYLKYIEHGLVKDPFTAKMHRATSDKYVPCSVGRSDAFLQHRKEQDMKMKIKEMNTVTITNMAIVNEDGLTKKKVKDNHSSKIVTFGKPYEVEVKAAKRGFYRPDLAKPKESSLSESFDSFVDQEEENDKFNFGKAISEVAKVFFSVPE